MNLALGRDGEIPCTEAIGGLISASRTRVAVQVTRLQDRR